MNGHLTETLTPAAGMMAAALVATLPARFGPDIVAAAGASVAAFIVAVEAQKKQRDLWHTISVVLASIAAGWMLPGVLMWGFFPAHYDTLPWQGWAGMGFVFGLLGWAVTAAILALRGRVPGVVGQLADRLAPSRREQPPAGQDHET